MTEAAELDDYAPLSRLIREWQATAAVHADPPLAARLAQAIDAHGDSVPLPAG